MSHHSRTAAAGGLIAVTALALAACAGGADPDGAVAFDGTGLGTDAEIAAFEELYNAAIEAGETQLVIYGISESETIMSAFETRFPGIDVISQDLVGAERDAKLAAERTSGNHVGDVATDGREMIGFMSNGGVCAPVDLFVDVDEQWVDFDSRAFANGVSVFGTVYNTDMLEESEVPKSWEEFLDPKWKGKITTVDPTLAGRLTMATFGQMLVPETNAQELGVPFLEKLKEQDLNTVSADPLMVQAVATGETPLAMLVHLRLYIDAAASGAPIGISFPLESNNQWTLGSMCKLENAPNAHAAELFVNWNYSPEAQTIRAAAGGFPVIDGVESPLGLPPIDQIDLLDKLPTLESLTGYVEAEKKVAEIFAR